MGRNNRYSKDKWVDRVIREKKEWIAQLENIQRLFPDDDREYISWQIKTTLRRSPKAFAIHAVVIVRLGSGMQIDLTF